jgi:hypothetical protein
MALEELKAKLSPESQQAVNQSQRQRHPLKRPHDYIEEPAPGDEQDNEVRDEIDDIKLGFRVYRRRKSSIPWVMTLIKCIIA